MDENAETTPPMPPTHVPEVPEDDKAETWTGDPVEETDETKSLTKVAEEVLAGEWGTGQERRKALFDAGYDPNAVKAEIVRIANGKT